MQNLNLIISIASSKPLIIRALKIAFVVGIILNLINQGDKILAYNFQEVNLAKLLLTFTVPFCVSMYTAIAMKIKFHIGEKAVADAVLKCKNCNSCMNIKKEQIIPFCNTCKDKTKWRVTSIKDKNCQQHK